MNLTLRELGREILAYPEFTEKLQQDQPDPLSIPLVLLHIPKTAGTTLGHLLKAAHPDAPTLDGLAVAQRLRKMSDAARRDLRLVLGHISHSACQLIPGPKRLISVLRMPGPRVLSYYEFIARSPNHPDHALITQNQLSFGEYLEASKNGNIRPWLDNTQIRLISGCDSMAWIGREAEIFEIAIANLVAPPMRFGFSEEFDAFQCELVSEGILASRSKTRLNVAPVPADLHSALSELSPNQRIIFDDYIKWDSWFYDIAYRIKQAGQQGV
ncbi:MAG: hypothetical protein AAGI10_03360 [Pseudomonadota bacterium]